MKTQDIKSFAEQLQQKLKDELETIHVEGDQEIIRIGRSIRIVKASLLELKDFVHPYNFSDKIEEIYFFKEIKPVFASQYYYYERLLEFKMKEPVDNTESKIDFYQRELMSIQNALNHNPEFYRYCLTNAIHMDHLYFIRDSNKDIHPDTDSKFSTPHDNTVALLLANKMLRDYVLATIKKVANEEGSVSQSSLRWTGSKTSLIELIYALQSVEVLNNGKTDIKEIASSFEHLFNINLGNYYRSFQDLRLRKSGMTNFLDQLKDKFIQRVDELDQHH